MNLVVTQGNKPFCEPELQWSVPWEAGHPPSTMEFNRQVHPPGAAWMNTSMNTVFFSFTTQYRDMVFYVVCILQPGYIFHMGFSIKESRLHFTLLQHASPANACVTMISILEPFLHHNDVYLVCTICLDSPHGNSGFKVMKITLTELSCGQLHMKVGFPEAYCKPSDYRVLKGK